MVRLMNLFDPQGAMLGGKPQIAGDQRSVADRGHEAWIVKLAIAINDKAGIDLVDERRVQVPRENPSKGVDPDVPGDVTLKIGSLKTKGAKGPWDQPAGVIAHEQKPGRTAQVFYSNGLGVVRAEKTAGRRGLKTAFSRQCPSFRFAMSRVTGTASRFPLANIG